jgi:tellurite methyltransferase
MSDSVRAGHFDRLAPTRWLTDHARLLPVSGDALDVACGRGRHALWLAARGLRVHAVDRDSKALAALRTEAGERGVEVRTQELDLEAGTRVVAESAYDVVVVVHYLHRPLFSQIIAALRPGGMLVYETFTTAQAAHGKPTSPDFLLKPGELQELVVPLDVVASREGAFDGRMVASVVARRTAERGKRRCE